MSSELSVELSAVFSALLGRFVPPNDIENRVPLKMTIGEHWQRRFSHCCQWTVSTKRRLLLSPFLYFLLKKYHHSRIYLNSFDTYKCCFCFQEINILFLIELCFGNITIHVFVLIAIYLACNHNSNEIV